MIARYLLAICFATCLMTPLAGQDYVRMMDDPQANFYDIQEAFHQYWKGKSPEKGLGYKQFRRFEAFMVPRVYPSGQFPRQDIAFRTFREFMRPFRNRSAQNRQANWTQYMYHDTLDYTHFSAIPGHGRVSCLEVSPKDSNTIFIGTPSGGLWVTRNGGGSWSPLTDDLPVLGVSDIAIHPDNDSIMYIGTGDNAFIYTYSIGVLKSTDGGNSWNTTGLVHQVNQTRQIRRLLMHPHHPDTLWAATTVGIFRTDDGGANWAQVSTVSARDLEFKPGNPSIVYATSSGGFYRSLDGGASFQASGLPENSAISRMEMAVTPADSQMVYVIAADASNGGMYDLYRSTDAGATFAPAGVTTNVLSFWPSGTAGGQAWYDMDIAVDPTDANLVYTAGTNIWKSTDGGVSFAPTSNWNAPGTSAYVHADVHKLEFDRGRLFTSCDGGIFRSNDGGNTWTDLSSNLTIYQIYAMSQSPHDDHEVIAGMQDVGSSIYRGTNWTTITWGDGFESYFDRNFPLRLYTSAHLGQYFRSSFGINGFSMYTPPTGETAPFASVLEQDPSNPNTFYVGFQNVWRSTTATSTWQQVSNFGNSSTLQRLRVAPSNPDAIYTTSNFVAYRTLDGGTTWANISAGLPTNVAAFSGLHVDPQDHLRIWVTFSGYSAAKKVYHSTDGGTTWQNISQNLPNLPANCVVTEGSLLNGLYVGMDVGVYYTNDTIAGWVPFLAGLPNVIVNDLDVVPSLNSIRAATFGRGVWESFLFSDPAPVGVQAPEPGADALLLYPNPARERIVVDHHRVSDLLPVRLEVFAADGRMVRSQNLTQLGQPRHFVYTYDLPAGVYTVSVLDAAGKRVTGRFWRGK